MRSFQEMISYVAYNHLEDQCETKPANKEIPVHGSQHPKKKQRAEGKDTRYSEDAGHGSVSQDEKGRILFWDIASQVLMRNSARF